MIRTVPSLVSSKYINNSFCRSTQGNYAIDYRSAPKEVPLIVEISALYLAIVRVDYQMNVIPVPSVVQDRQPIVFCKLQYQRFPFLFLNGN